MKSFSCMIRASFLVGLCGLLIGCTWSNPTKKFIKNVQNFTMDGLVTEPEYNILKTGLPLGGCIIEGKQINDEASLISFLHYKGITESAVALKLAAQVELNKLAIYLETSASMAGYSHSGNPSFTAPIIAIPNAVASDVTIETNFISGAKKAGKTTTVIQALPKDEFERNLANGKIAKAESSPLDAIISVIIDSTNVNTVSCLITDGIISGTNEEIIKDREFAIKNLPLLEQRIRTAMSKASGKDLEVLIYRMETSFAGTYYDYRNTKHTLNVDNRPYFMMFFGYESILKDVEQKIERESDFIYVDKFATWKTDNYKTIESGNIYKVPTCQAQYVLNVAQRVMTFKKTPEVPVDFDLRLNLTGLPENYVSEEALRSGLELYHVINGIEVAVPEFIQGVSTINATLNEYNVRVQIDPTFFNTFAKSCTLQLRRKASLDAWWDAKSSELDSDMGTYPNNNTFALNKMMRGILNGFAIHDEDLKDAINVSIKLEK